jgi:demethylmenaquinone methyltransferase/2-methoxy-6-polyprenyl-1,4-benzoquinol methylase
MKKIKPYISDTNKKEQISKMFDNISDHYDILNGILTLGIHKVWRKLAVKKINNNPKKILDLATGTGDFAIIAAKNTGAKITGVDISKKMLEKAKMKIEDQSINDKINFLLGDAENLNFDDFSFDAVTVGFGVRNFDNLNKGLEEIYRVLKKNGMVIILEPSIPKFVIFKQLYNVYFNYILPFIGRFISNDKFAYSYLSNSVNAFPSGKKFIDLLQHLGFRNNQHFSLTFGVVSLYVAIK